MSLIFCDGFDDGLATLGKWDLLFGSAAVIASGGRNGNRLYLYDGQSAGTPTSPIKRSLGTANEHATITYGFAMQVTDVGTFTSNGGTFANLGTLCSDAGATSHVSIGAEGTTLSPSIQARRGVANGTVIGSASVPAWIANQWYYFEIQVVLHDTTGSVVVKINGTTVLTLTNVDTKNGGTKTVFDSIAFANASRGNSWNASYDDLYITNGAGSANTGFLGDVAVETLYPSGDGSSSQFVGSDGNSVNNSLLVDEAVPDTADYVQSATAGNRDLYAMANLVRTAGTIYGVQSAAYGQSSDSGSVSIKNVVKSGATVLAGAAIPLVTTYGPKLTVFEQDPDTSAAWLVAAVNAVEAGVEVA